MSVRRAKRTIHVLSTLCVWLAFLVLWLPLPSAADGKVYASDLMPEIPDQRALLVHDGRREILLLQSRFAVSQVKPVSAFGWVVPVPEAPEFAALDADAAQRLFRDLARATSPRLISFISPLVAALAIGALIWTLLPPAAMFPHRVSLRSGAVFAMIWVILGVVALPADVERVEVVKALKVGAYDAKVVRARSEADLIGWLKENGFSYSDDDAEAFAAYIRKKWVFVTAKIASDRNQNFAAGGISPPLLIRFNASEPVYPLALTGTAGRPTEISLYAMAATKLDAGGRLPLRFFDSGYSIQNWLPDKNDVREFFSGFDRTASLAKYSGSLKSEQMREDLVLKPMQNATPYRGWTINPLSLVYAGASFAVGILAWLLRLTRLAYLKELSAPYYFLLSLFLTPVVGLAHLAGEALQEFLRWRKAQRALREHSERKSKTANSDRR